MKLTGTNSNKKQIALSIVMLTIFALIPALFAVKNIRISPDSMIYSLISQEIISGNGVGLPIIYDIRDNYTFTNRTVPYMAQPPLLPVMYALFGGVTANSFLPAQIINVISHISITLFTFLLMRRLHNKGIALLTGMLTAVSIPLLWNTHHMLSEPLFIALTTGTVYTLVLSRHAGGNRSVSLITAGVLASAAILTRIPGIALIPVFLWELLRSARERRANILPVMLAAILPVITTAAFFIRNRLVSGSIVGWSPNAPEKSYIDAVTGTLKMIFLQFNLNELMTVILLFTALAGILLVIVSAKTRRALAQYWAQGLDIAVVFMLSYTAVISHAMAKVQPLFELRYISPLVPFLFILSITMIIAVWEAPRSREVSRIPLYGLIATLSLLTVGNFYKTYSYSGELFSKRNGHYRILSSPAYNWIKATYGEETIFTTNRPFHLSFFGGYRTIRLPHSRFYNNYQMPADMRSFLPERMSHFGSRILVLFDRADEKYEGEYITQLFNDRKDDSSFRMTKDFPDAVIYELKK